MGCSRFGSYPTLSLASYVTPRTSRRALLPRYGVHLGFWGSMLTCHHRVERSCTVLNTWSYQISKYVFGVENTFCTIYMNSPCTLRINSRGTVLTLADLARMPPDKPVRHLDVTTGGRQEHRTERVGKEMRPHAVSAIEHVSAITIRNRKNRSRIMFQASPIAAGAIIFR